MYGPPEIAQALRAVQDGEATFQARAALEHHLVMLLQAEGLAALESTLKSLPGFGFEATPSNEANTVVFMSLAPDRPPLVITAYRADDLATLDVSTALPGEPVPDHPHHQRFYEVWEGLMGTEDADGLDGRDRAVFLIASLEADLMNGGFGQYLTNSEGSHLDEVLGLLDGMGATGTAGLLRQAAGLRRAGATFTESWDEHPEELGRLDDEFLALGEDLPAMTVEMFFD